MDPVLKVYCNEIYSQADDERWIYEITICGEDLTLAAGDMVVRAYYSNTGIEISPAGTDSGLVKFSDIFADCLTPREACIRAALVQAMRLERSSIVRVPDTKLFTDRFGIEA